MVTAGTICPAPCHLWPLVLIDHIRLDGHLTCAGAFGTLVVLVYSHNDLIQSHPTFLQVSYGASEDQSYFTYDNEAAAEAMGSFVHSIAEPEYNGAWARLNVDLVGGCCCWCVLCCGVLCCRAHSVLSALC